MCTFQHLRQVHFHLVLSNLDLYHTFICITCNNIGNPTVPVDTILVQDMPVETTCKAVVERKLCFY